MLTDVTPVKPEDFDSGGDEGSYSEAVGTRLSPKTKRRFDSYKDAEEIGNAEALRRLTRDALDRRDEPDADTPPTLTFIITLAVAVGWIYLTYTQRTSTGLTVLTGVYLLVALTWTGLWPLYHQLTNHGGEKVID